MTGGRQASLAPEGEEAARGTTVDRARVSGVLDRPRAVVAEATDKGDQPSTSAQKRLRKRQAILDAAPALLGAAWVKDWCEQLGLEGRPTLGGWPGTLPEARARVLVHLAQELSRHGMAVPGADEVARVTQATYVRAKSAWSSAVRDTEAELRRNAGLVVSTGGSVWLDRTRGPGKLEPHDFRACGLAGLLPGPGTGGKIPSTQQRRAAAGYPVGR